MDESQTQPNWVFRFICKKKKKGETAQSTLEGIDSLGKKHLVPLKTWGSENRPQQNINNHYRW